MTIDEADNYMENLAKWDSKQARRKFLNSMEHKMSGRRGRFDI
jgi:hypothetical protein